MAPSSTRLRDRLDRTWPLVTSWLKRWDWLIYIAVSGAFILGFSSLFYSSLRLQTLYAYLWHDPKKFDVVAQTGAYGEWSAPLDDVFIHFDFARSTARGYPFQWLDGNGYSSGGTSLFYPFVLAFGYWLGFRSLDLMVWAGVVACVSVLGLLMATRRLFASLPTWTSYLGPPLLLCTGVLDWTLFSGMEVALFLGLWGWCLVAWDDLYRCDDANKLFRGALNLGVACLLLVATRPEAAPTVAIFSISAAWAIARRFGRRKALVTLTLAASPGALLVVAQALVNRALTGDFTAAGALAKLEAYHPYLTAAEVREKWWFHVQYQFFRVTDYHLSSLPVVGWVLWVLAGLSLVYRSTRRHGLLLWGSAVAWVVVVALNGQVRWQNERYTMPALAWLLLAAGLGLGASLTRVHRKRWQSTTSRVAIVAALATFIYFQIPRFKDQVWFFGRASRNILDQHVTAGRVLRYAVKPTPHRILLSDAGAIPYAADLPAVDLIGLGGYHRLPFARATRLGAPGGLELIERLPAEQRPDVFALYPSWWPTFPLWFGQRLDEVSVRGNVICGGQSKVLYRADFSAMDRSGKPFLVPPASTLVDHVDVADVLSEKEHAFRMTREATGHLTMKLLADPNDAKRDLWDAGRLMAPGANAKFEISVPHPNRSITLLFRVAPAEPASFEVYSGARSLGTVDLRAADNWQEVPLTVPSGHLQTRAPLEIVPRVSGFALYHIWVVQPD